MTPFQILQAIDRLSDADKETLAILADEIKSVKAVRKDLKKLSQEVVKEIETDHFGNVRENLGRHLTFFNQ